MADVYAARHRTLNQSVALKVMTHERAVEARFRADFRMEVQAAARLNHPSIVRVFDYGVLEQAPDRRFVVGSPYLVMEVADRGSLDRTRLNSWGAARRVVLQILDALAYSHARGLIHRDVKPANVLLASTADGRVRVKLADFGIAHAQTGVPGSDRAIGTFAYTPPEQLRAEWRRFGPPTDLYALGCLIWQVLTGSPPFQAGSSNALALMQLTAPIPAFEPRIAVPDGLLPWLTRLLQKEPGDRFQRAADAALAFMALGSPAELADPDRSDEFLAPSAGTGEPLTHMTYPDTIVVPSYSQPLSRLSSGALASGDARALDGASTAHGAAAPLSRLDARPGLPRTWRRPDIAYEPAIAGLGLGLFGLREVPFVGRESERDAIWTALRLIEHDGICRAVVLRGASGAGKSRMAQWVCQRADEVGGATVLMASHATGRPQGLRDLVQRSLVTYGLVDPTELLAHITVCLRAIWPEGAAEFLDGEAAALAAIVLPEEFPRASQGERIGAVTRLVRGVASLRSVVLLLDDAQWDLESIALAAHLAGQKSLPALVVLTIQDEAASDLPEVESTLASLLGRTTADELKILPLADADQTELVHRLIGLDRELCETVSKATRGNPLFAVHLVGDWVERGALLATRKGFVLKQGADVPDDLHTLWVRRLAHVCGGHRGIDQLAALEAAAALSGGVRLIEWEAVCRAAGTMPNEQLLPTLINLGMVIRESDGWRFVHRLLAASLERLSIEGGRWRDVHGACGEALSQLYIDSPDAVAERCAAHYLRAERWTSALAPLKRAILNRFASRDYHEATQLIEHHGVALRAAGIVDGEHHSEQRLFESMLGRRMQGATHTDSLTELLAEATANGWPWQVGTAHHELGQEAGTQGRLEEALEHYGRAWEAFEALGDPAELAVLLESRAWVFKAKGDTASAERDLTAALETHRTSGDNMRELNTINSLAFTFLAAGDYDASREIAHMGIELGRELGHRGAEAGCWTTLGEIERFEDNVDVARECYRRAEELDTLCGSKHALLVRANAALLEVGANNWSGAIAMIDEVEPAMVVQGQGWMSPFFSLARSCCHAGLGAWPLADELWLDATSRIDASSIVERDVAWLAEIAADVASRAGDAARERRALSYALAQWRGLDDGPQVHRAARRLAAIA